MGPGAGTYIFLSYLNEADDSPLNGEGPVSWRSPDCESEGGILGHCTRPVSYSVVSDGGGLFWLGVGGPTRLRSSTVSRSKKRVRSASNRLELELKRNSSLVNREIKEGSYRRGSLGPIVGRARAAERKTGKMKRSFMFSGKGIDDLRS